MTVFVVKSSLLQKLTIAKVFCIILKSLNNHRIDMEHVLYDNHPIQSMIIISSEYYDIPASNYAKNIDVLKLQAKILAELCLELKLKERATGIFCKGHNCWFDIYQIIQIYMKMS